MDERTTRTTGRGLAGLLRDTRGAAMTETVIMLPFFILVFGCIVYAYNVHEAWLDTANRTRQHAWRHASDSCEGSVPDGTRSSTSTVETGTAMGAISTTLTLGLMPDPEMEEVSMSRSDEVGKPKVLGEGSYGVGHGLTVMCNEETTDVDDTIHDAYWGMFGLPELL